MEPLYKPMILLFLTSLLLTSCNSEHLENARSIPITAQVEYYYDLNQVVEAYNLPRELEEISGLYYLDKNKLLTVEDETATVYEFDLNERKVSNKIDFGGEGDFEGVEVVDNLVYVIRSDGTLFSFSYTGENSAEANATETGLGEENNAEGLGFNPESGHLLIALKDEGGIEGIKAEGKAVYQYNLKAKQLIDQPFFVITTEQIKQFMEANDVNSKNIRFKPSAIAHNPVDGHFYVTASNGKLMLVLDKTGEIKASYPLDMLNQPEGICFSPEGNLFLSSEGKGSILKFTLKRK